MFELTIKAKDAAELEAAIEKLAGRFANADKPAVGLSDFPMQDIINHITRQGFSVEAPTKIAEEKPAPAKASRAKAKPAETQTETQPAETEAETTTSAAPLEGADAREAAIKLVMAVYGDPKGKKLATETLKLFGVKNFHLVPDDKGAELYSAVQAAILAAGLKP